MEFVQAGGVSSVAASSLAVGPLLPPRFRPARLIDDTGGPPQASLLNQTENCTRFAPNKIGDDVYSAPGVGSGTAAPYANSARVPARGV